MTAAVWIWGTQALFSAGSLATRRPWTALVSARRYPPPVRDHPLFKEANVRITAAWTAYFAIGTIATALAGPWVGLVFVVPTPVLAWAAFRYADRYAASRLATSAPTERRAMSNDRQSDLRALIDGKTDEEILAAVRTASGSYEAFLDETMRGMVDAFQPRAAEDCVIGYEISTPDGDYAYRVEVRGDGVTTARRTPDDARVVLRLALPDYLRLINGLLDGTKAFMAGRLKLRGDVMFAPQIDRIFRRG